MPDRHGTPSSRDGDWFQDEIEGLGAPKNGLSKTLLEVYALIRGPLTGNRGSLYDFASHHLREESNMGYGTLAPMPDRPCHQNVPRNQLTLKPQAIEPRSVGQTESEVFDSFGFLRVNGKWVDPDSEEAIYNAWNSHLGVTNPLVPGSSGPYILSKSEESIVYGEFVNDEDDDEGDPRNSRISPETFAMWAEGAVKGEEHQHEVIEQPVSKAQAKSYNAHIGHDYSSKYPRRFSSSHGLTAMLKIQVRRGHRRRSKERAKLTISIPQYCAETGHYMSPAYSNDEDPIPLLSPQGVNMDRYPMNFAYSYPLEALQLRRFHYFDARIADDIPATSSSERITSEFIREALTIDGDPESGIRQMNEVREYINQLQLDCRAKEQEGQTAEVIYDKLEKEVYRLRITTQLLRNRVSRMITEARQASQHRRVKEQLKSSVEMLTHRRARLDIKVQKYNGYNEALRKQRDKFQAERQGLLNTFKTLCKAERLDSH